MKNYLAYVLLVVVGINADICGVVITVDVDDPSLKITNVAVTVPKSDVNPIYQNLSSSLPSAFSVEEYSKLLTATLLNSLAIELNFCYAGFKELFRLRSDKLREAFEKGAIPLIAPFMVDITMRSEKGAIKKDVIYTIIFDKIYGATPITHSSEEEDEGAEYYFSCRGQDPSMLVIRQREKDKRSQP